MNSKIYNKIFKSSFNFSFLKTLLFNFVVFNKIIPKLYLGKRTSVINTGGSVFVHGTAYFDCKNGGQFFYDSHIVLESKSTITLGNKVNFFSAAQIKCFNGASISIGNDTYFSGPVTIHSKNRINIGSNCSISWGVTIIDSDFHSIQGKDVRSLPVIIEDDVWIGCNVTVLKGVIIKKGCVIAAGSVVTKSTDHVGIYAGNPAILIKALDEEN